MRVATWNVNSIRTRIDRVLAFCDRADIDVLAMQETKAADGVFPSERFTAAGYEIAWHGLNQWNGVAIASRVGLDDISVGFPGQPTWGDPPVVEARALGATCGGVRIWSLYIPNGRELADPHYAYKLEWLAALRQAVNGWLTKDPEVALALLGDWNVALLDTDVWDIAAFEARTHVSEPERAAIRAFENLGLSEVSRDHLPDEHTYTYWDYQQLRFPRNQGMRIDLAFASSALVPRVTSVSIERIERKGKGPSDHVPVVIEIDV